MCSQIKTSLTFSLFYFGVLFVSNTSAYLTRIAVRLPLEVLLSYTVLIKKLSLM